MRAIDKDHDDYLHPLWLGIILLFTVIIIIGMLCILRKKCGAQILHQFNRLCCRNKSNNANKHSTIPNAYNWTPAYIPTSSVSPKIYTSVQKIQMNSIDNESPSERANSQEDEVFPIEEEADHANKPISQPNTNRNSETARKFFASMRKTSQGQNSSSVDSYNNEPTLLPSNRHLRANRRDKLRFLRRQNFFQSIANEKSRDTT